MGFWFQGGASIAFVEKEFGVTRYEGREYRGRKTGVYYWRRNHDGFSWGGCGDGKGGEEESCGEKGERHDDVDVCRVM